jgi:hypothetical protein
MMEKTTPQLSHGALRLLGRCRIARRFPEIQSRSFEIEAPL